MKITMRRMQKLIQNGNEYIGELYEEYMMPAQVRR